MCGKLCDAESLTREGGCNFIPVLKLRAAAAAAGTGWLSADTLEASASADGREIDKIRSEPGLHVKPYTGSFVRPTTTITLPIIVAINERFVGSFSRGALRCLHKRSRLTKNLISSLSQISVATSTPHPTPNRSRLEVRLSFVVILRRANPRPG